jgi:hypothetical protein
LIVTTGRVLPATMSSEAELEAIPSLTVSFGLKAPACMYTNVGLAAVESTTPSPWKSHA